MKNTLSDQVFVALYDLLHQLNCLDLGDCIIFDLGNVFGEVTMWAQLQHNIEYFLCIINIIAPGYVLVF